MSRRGVALAVAVTAPLAAGVAYVASAGPRAADTPVVGVTTATVAVTRGTLAEHEQLGGVLGYTGSYTVDYQGAPGVLTAAAAPGATVRRGGILFRVADHPVRLLLGAVPAFRNFGYGMSDGPDVLQLERNLTALGFSPGRTDRHFSGATAAAIRRWQGARGQQRTGRLAPGEIVFLPTPLRVGQQRTRVGATAAPGVTVLTGTSTTRAVIAPVDTGQRASMRVGDPVEVALPDTDPIRARVTAIGHVATPPAGAGAGEQPGDTDAATVPVTIAVRLPRGLDLDEAPVTVDITTDSRPDVLVLPIAALLARPGGGYQVRLAGGPAVAVEPGEFDESTGRVEIVRGLAEGQSVEVPAR